MTGNIKTRNKITHAYDHRSHTRKPWTPEDDAALSGLVNLIFYGKQTAHSLGRDAQKINGRGIDTNRRRMQHLVKVLRNKE